MRTTISTISQIKRVFVETLLNHTNRVSKISDGSVLNGIAYAVAKIYQKVQKDIAIIESKLFPSLAFGEHLDRVAMENGVAPRFQASGSSTYLLIWGAVGTQYLAGTHIFTGSHGINFELLANCVIPSSGYIYANARSMSIGAVSSVSAHTINVVSPQPAGHQGVTNEFMAAGGADLESDEAFRNRIMSAGNIAAMDTMARLLQVFIKIDSRVLRIFKYGMDDNGKSVIGVLTRDGAGMTDSELMNLTVNSAGFLSLSDYRPFTSDIFSIKLVNVGWMPVDVDFRVHINQNYNSTDVRRNIQIRMSQYFDYRKWEAMNRVEWDDLLEIVKRTDGVRYCPDTYFRPRVDIVVPNTELPRVRKFIMRDPDGVIIYQSGNQFSQIYFPNEPDISYQATIIAQL